MARARAPRRLSATQLRAIASRGQAGRSQISRAARAQRSSVARTALRQPRQGTTFRRTIRDSVSVRQPTQRIRTTSRSRFPGGQASSTRVITQRQRTDKVVRSARGQRITPRTRISSIPKPAPRRITTRGQVRQRQPQAAQRRPFKLTVDFADLRNVTQGVVAARQSIRANVFEPVRAGGARARQRFDFFVGDFFGPTDSARFGFTRKGGVF